jgi:hypothetical protein
MLNKKMMGLITDYISENPSVMIGNFTDEIHRSLDSIKGLEKRNPRKYQILRDMANKINLPQSLNGNCDKLTENFQVLARTMKNFREIDRLGLEVGDKILIKNHGVLRRVVSVILPSGYFRVNYLSFNISPFDVIQVLK